jgi:hypothetical protein
MRDPVIKTSPQDFPSILQVISMSEIMPKTYGQCRKKDTTAAATTVLHFIISLLIGNIRSRGISIMYFHQRWFLLQASMVTIPKEKQVGSGD